MAIAPRHLHHAPPENLINLGDIGLPEIPLLGRHRLNTAVRGLGAHSHKGILEICYLVSGMRTYQVGGQDFHFKGGEVFLTFPDESHGSGGHIHGKGELFWLHVKCSPPPKRFLGMENHTGLVLLDALLTLPTRCFRGGDHFQVLMERLFQLHSRRESYELAKVECIAALIQLLSLVIQWSKEAAEREMTPEMRFCTEYIQKNVEGRLSLEDLAEISKLSLSRFKSRFRQEVGIPPKEYILREKVKKAEDLLRGSSKSVTEIAHELSFSTSQYFATVFKRFTNSCPSSLRR